MKHLSWFFFLIVLSGCLSAEKHAYDSLIDSKKKFSDNKKNSIREIAYLKNMSHFEESSFQFVTKQMKNVITNYSKMKQQLVKIETKLDQLLNQLNGIDTAPQENNMQNIQEEPVALEESENTDEVALEESENTDEIESTTLIEQEITDNTDIFPIEEIDIEDNTTQKVLNNPNIKQENKTDNYLNEAKSLFQQKSYENAISKLQKYRDENPKGQHYSEATYYIGQSFKNLKMPIEANVFFKEIIQSHPQSLWASRAKKSFKE